MSPRFLANLRLARWQPKAETSIDGATWSPLTVLTGTVRADATSTVRWTCSLTVAADSPAAAALTPFGARLRLSIGMVHAPTDIEWVPLGVYRVDTTERDDTASIDVTGSSREALIIDDRFYQPRTFRPQSARVLLSALIWETIPGASIRWDADDSTVTTQIVEPRDRWAVIDGDTTSPSIARSLGATVFCDARGVFCVRTVPSLTDRPVWTLDTGDTGVLISPTETLTRDGVYNAVIATGATDDGSPPVGPAVAEDLDPASPTYVHGPFGRVPRFYASPFLATVAQCRTTAQALLATALGLHRQVNLTSVVNYALEVGDVVTARMPDGRVANHVIDGIDFALDGSSMQLATRATATRLAGTITDLPAVTGDIDVTAGASSA